MSDWISVIDRMPPISHDKIVLWNGRYPQIGVCLADSRMGNAAVKLMGITHWLPLPAGPKRSNP
ncbi:MAG TPA: DUF551 domain-containing protein [Xanthobacteraceae bacterium]|nr:DUF551 domain-containing protein [Xanthobacteraceae bacterium]